MDKTVLEQWRIQLEAKSPSCKERALLKIAKKQCNISDYAEIYSVVWRRDKLKKTVVFVQTLEDVYILKNSGLIKNEYMKIPVEELPNYVFILNHSGSCVYIDKEGVERIIYLVEGHFFIEGKKNMAIRIKKRLDFSSDYWIKKSSHALEERKSLFDCFYERAIEVIKSRGELSYNIKESFGKFIEEQPFLEKAGYILLRNAILRYRMDDIYQITGKMVGSDYNTLEVIKTEIIKEIENLKTDDFGQTIRLVEVSEADTSLVDSDGTDSPINKSELYADLVDALFKKYVDHACNSSDVEMTNDFEQYVKQCQQYIKEEQDREACYKKWINVFKTDKDIISWFIRRDELGFSSLHYKIFEFPGGYRNFLKEYYNEGMDPTERYKDLEDPFNILYDYGYVLHCRGDISGAKDIIMQKREFKELGALFDKAQKNIKVVEGVIATYSTMKSLAEVSRKYNRIRNQMVADDVQRRIDEERERIMDGKSMNYHGWVRAQERLERFKKANGLYDLEEMGQNDYYEDDEPSLDVLDRLLMIKQTLIDSLSEIREQQAQYVDGWLKIYEETRCDYANSDNGIISEIYRLSSDSEYYKTYIKRLSRPKVLVFQFGHFWYIDKEIYDQYFNSDESDGDYSNKQTRGDQSAKSGFKSKEFVNKDKIKKPYGDRWFSPEARKDIRRLKKEYRRLAVMFHPDNFDGDPGIFVEIQMERMDILSKMKV